jgi:prevent-host-death family protein
MTVKTLESRAARENWRDLLDTATAGQADVIITRYGKPVTAMIRYEDYIAMQEELVKLRAQRSEAYQTMLASESTLSHEWNSPEEDEAWADL